MFVSWVALLLLTAADVVVFFGVSSIRETTYQWLSSQGLQMDRVLVGTPLVLAGGCFLCWLLTVIARQRRTR